MSGSRPWTQVSAGASTRLSAVASTCTSIWAPTRRRLANCRPTGDDGSASVEFILFGVGLLVPLAYLLVTIFSVQSAAYGVSSASREAGRAFVQAPAGADPSAQAYAAAWVALQDYGIDLAPGQLVITCSASPCLTPGATVDVSVDVAVALPLLPSLFDEAPASVAVHGRHTAVVDRFRPGG